jgi:hypothetical protein
MRLAAKMTLWACTAPAVAALLLTGAGAANAAVAAPAALSGAAHSPGGPGGPGPHCNWWQLERWNLNGPNTVDLVYGTGHYTYYVSFKQNGSCLGGTLTDTYLPPGSPKLQISGIVNGSYITFSVTYPTGYQGTRTFRGNINWHGDASGTWKETGTENGTGTWYLAYGVDHACSHYYWWDPQRECHVFSH